MKKIDADDPIAQSADLKTDNVERLKELFPELVTEGADGAAINVDVLKALVGDATVTDADEKYGLNWHGKRQARQLALTPSTGTLRPCPEESVDWDTTQNLMIEGDNLEVLKLLQKSYAGKVKLIYIDPPYNTGKDFVYPDNFRDALGNYLELTGQVEGGRKISSNTEVSGRFHTDWLNMIYPRLNVAKSLLRDDGCIFISVDDAECSRLKPICDEIFGEENFVAQVVWEKMYTTKNDAAYLSPCHEYVLVYARSIVSCEFHLLPRTAEMDARYTNPDKDVRGPWKAIPLYAKGERKNGRYAVISPSTGKVHWPSQDSHWLYAEEDTKKLVDDRRIYFGRDGNAQPNVKRFLSEVQKGTKAKTLWKHAEVGSNDSAKRELRDLYEGERVPFDFPKPTSLVRHILALATHTNSSDVVLDFFAGSGTTAHAVMAKNVSDGGSRRFVLVQLPEPIDQENKDQVVAAAYCDKIDRPPNIAELTKDRLRRAGAELSASSEQRAASSEQRAASSEQRLDTQNRKSSLDLGFRVYKLDKSNIRAWQPGSNLETDLLDSIDHIAPGRSQDDLLTELLLKLGLDLCVPIEQRQIAGKTVHAIGGGVLLACLDMPITIADAELLALGIAAWHRELAPTGDTTSVFRDAAFDSDVAKTNLAKILEQHGIVHVRSL